MSFGWGDDGGRRGVVRTLLQTAPETTLVEDEDGNSPEALAVREKQAVREFRPVLDAVAMAWRGLDAEWSLVPVPCPGLRRVLHLAATDEVLRHVAARLSAEDARILHTVLTVLSLNLPGDLCRRVACSVWT